MSAHGRYTVLRKIADGGTAEVFLAQMEGSAGFKRLVVLKRVRPDLWANEMFRKSLLDEAHIMMGLHHGNIVQVLDLGAAANRYFLAFELVDGWTLSQVLTRAKAAQLELPLSLSLHVMAQVCRGLAYAHSRSENRVPLKIVHRDVSPQNVLVSEQGEVKLADFGIARARTRMTTSQVGSVKGKPAFMSPEQVSGLELDARSDLFPIGTMLYQLVTGELPFKAKTGVEEMVLIAKGKYVSPEKKRPDLPKELVVLIRRALEGNRERRFQSADEMLLEIERVQRTVLEVTGQTELKAWLTSLAAKDGARPLSRVGEEVTKPPGWDAAAPVIELQDEDVEIVTPPPVQQPPPPPPLKPRQRRRWPMVVIVTAMLAGVVVLVAPELLKQEPMAQPASEPIEPAIAVVTPPAEVVAAPVAEVAMPTAFDAAVEIANEPEPEPTPEVVPEVQAAVEVPVDAGVSTAVALPAPIKKRDTASPVVAPATIPLPPPSPSIATDVNVSVLMETVPPDAELRIGKRLFGKTPIPIRLNIGIAFELVFSKKGFKEAKVLHFVARKNKQRVRVVLEPTSPAR